MTTKTTTDALRLLVASTTALLLSGCPVAGLPDPPTPECTHASECPEGKLCGPAGLCIDECRGDRDCPRGLTCRDGVCQAPPGTCARDADCATGEVCAVNGKCVNPCDTTAECGGGFVCVGGACLATSGGCGRDVDCGPGQVCAADGRCVAPCATDAQCASGEQCSAGACVGQLTTTTACTAPSQCPNGQTCGTSGACAWLPATCAAETDCPATESCGAGMLCVDKCGTNRDCTEGLQCTAGVCTPPPAACVTAAECGSGQACSPGGRCVKACTQPADCAGSDECSAGACVPTGPAWAKLSGAVELTGLTDWSGVAVRVRGTSAAVELTTAADGRFSAAGLPPGRYTVTIDAVSVREGLVEVDVAAVGGQAVAVPTQTLTPVGTITGRVTLQGSSNHQGTQVAALMANASATTNASGDFTLKNVPVGTWQLAAAAGGFAASTVSGVVVQWNQATAVPAFSLSPLPVSNNTTFAFLSVPPDTATAAQPFVYTAVAGGGGVTNPTYAVVSGPLGFDIDGATGAVTWVPTTTLSGGSFVVTLSARGSGMTVFQIFQVTVAPGSPPLYAVDAYRLSQGADASWTWDGFRGISVLGTAPDGGATSFSVGRNAVTMTPTGSELLNGAPITGYAFGGASGTFTGARGAFGPMAATWPGGTVTSLAPVNTLQVGATPALRSVGSVTLQDAVVIGSITPISLPVTAVSGLSAVTGVSVPTGLVTSVTATTLTDAAATWGTDTLTSFCLLDAFGSNATAITANTDTTITTAGGLDGVFAAGARYFVGNCSGGTMRVTLSDSAASFGAIANARADLYLGVVPLGAACVVLASPAPTATSFTCNLPVQRYGDIAQLPTVGRYGLGTATGVLLTVTSTGAGFPASNGLVGARRLQFDPASSIYTIDSNTADSVTFRVALGQATTFWPGLTFRLTTFASPYWSDFAVSFTSGTLAGNHAGERMYLDAQGTNFPVVSNTASGAVIQLEWNRLPLTLPAGSWAAFAPASTGPVLVLTDAAGGLPPLLGQYLVRPLPWDRYGTIVASTPTQVTVNLDTNTNTMRDALATLTPGASWGTTSIGLSNQVRLELPLGGSPGLVPDSLVGRLVALRKNPLTSATIRGNGAASLLVEVSTAALSSFLALEAGDGLMLGDGNGDYVVTLTDSSAAWTPGQWVGQRVIGGTTVIGDVRSNTATSLELVMEDASRFNQLGLGVAFAFAPTNTSECSGSAGYVRATVTLAGATLAPDAYARLYRTGTVNLPVLSNTASALVVGVCANQFGAFVSTLGDVGLATGTDGLATAWLDDSGAAMTPGAYAGRPLYLPGTETTTVAPATNTATGFRFDFSPADFYALKPWLRTGEAYAVQESDGQLLLRLAGTFSPPAGALADRFVALLDADTGSTRGYLAEGNSATALTLRLPPADVSAVLQNGGALIHDHVTWGAGLVTKVTVPGSPWQPGELVGLRMEVGGYFFDAIANTANTVTVTADGLSSGWVRALLRAAVLQVRSTDIDGVVALPGGDALVSVDQAGTTSNALWRFGPGGLLGRLPAVEEGRAIALTPRPVTKGIIASTLTANGITSVRVQGAAWTPGQHAGAVARARNVGATAWQTAVVVSNTADTLTLVDGLGGPGRELVIEPHTFDVSGVTLVPDELAGLRLRLNGRDYAVRGNTTTTVSLYADLEDDDFPGPAALPGTAALRLDRPGRVAINDLQSDGATGVHVSADDGLWHWDGTRFTLLDAVASAPQLGAGTVASVTNSSITDTAATYTPDALAGARVRLGRGLYTVTGNTAQTLFLSSSFWDGALYSPPLPGEPYVVAEDTGFSAAETTSAAGGALWVGSASEGLYRRQGTTWTRYTVASTESAQGAADGLASDAVTGVHALSATEVYTWTAGVRSLRQLNGATWTTLTVASTESAPGAGDGLPNEFVNAVVHRGTDVFIGTDNGAVKRSGSTWTQYTRAQHAAWDYVPSLGFGPTGKLWLGTDVGIYEVP